MDNIAKVDEAKHVNLFLWNQKYFQNLLIKESFTCLLASVKAHLCREK